MQQKTPLQHQFIRKHKRKLSPKHNKQQLYSFKNLKGQGKKEEYQFCDKQPNKNEAEIVLDLKNQLSFLKEEMVKIVHSKLQLVPNDQRSSKLKLLDYYFPKQGDKPKIQSLHNEGSEDVQKASINEQSQQIKTVKSKERLKFSKIKKSQKFLAMSPGKKIDSTTEPSQNMQIGQHEQIVLKNQIIQPSLRQQLQSISQRNKKTLQFKLKSIISEQQENKNIISNCDNQKEQDKIDDKIIKSRDTIKLLSLSPHKEQKLAVCESKIDRLKKKVKEQELEGVKCELRDKSELLGMMERELQRVKGELSVCQKKLQKTLSQLGQTTQSLSQLQQQLKQSQTQTTILHDNANILQHKLKNRQYEIIKLQKIIHDHGQQYKDLQYSMNAVVEGLRGELKILSERSQRQLDQKIKLMDQTKKKEGLKDKQQQGVARSIMREESLSPVVSPIPSPRNNPLTAKEKQYLSAVRMHEKSIQNYQKDLNFLQLECKNLHHFKVMAKKQQLLIKDVNQLLLNEQLTKFNAKYEKKMGGSSINHIKEAKDLVAKRSSGNFNMS